MLRMITYGDGPYGEGMNTLLNSAASPNPRCVSKRIAITNGTSTTKMSEFEQRNSSQSFPDSRLIPVWPVAESRISSVCVAPFDSSRMRIEPTESVNNKNRDSYRAGYNYTLENVPSWMHYERASDTTFHASAGEVWDEGFWMWADDLPSGMTERQAWVVINAEEDENLMLAAEGYAAQNGLLVNKDVCARSRILVRQAADGTSGTSFTGISTLNIGFTGTVENNTRINIALVSDEPALSGIYFANGTTIGSTAYGGYESIANASGSTATINIDQIKAKFPNGYSISFDVYGSWEGVGPAGIIPVPSRQSHRVDISANGTVMFSPNMVSCGNMNVAGNDIDTLSNAIDKMRARCARIARIRYMFDTDTVTIEQDESTGICPIFYPSSLNGNSNAFEWMGSGSSTERSFAAIEVSNSELTVGMTSKNRGSDCPYEIYMSNNTSADSYVINGETITAGQHKQLSGSSFTINFSDSAKYPSTSTHRFYIRQVISDSTVASGNASPEYAHVQFTIQ